MSKKETPLTRRYWQSVGGALIEEFPAVLRTESSAQRLLDGVIVLGEAKAIVKHSNLDIKGKDIIVIQTKVMGNFIIEKRDRSFFGKGAR
jgi:hypothetical protein